jgi:hypothetical protein
MLERRTLAEKVSEFPQIAVLAERAVRDSPFAAIEAKFHPQPQDLIWP